MIALTTVVNAGRESEAIERLRLLPDLADAATERLGLIARWARNTVSGKRLADPLEPDLIGEQLVADEFAELPEALSAALNMDDVDDLIRPLEVLGRAAADHPGLESALQPILGEKLKTLCEKAVVQSRDEADQELLYGRTLSLAAVLEKAVATVKLDRALCLLLSARRDPTALRPRVELFGAYDDRCACGARQTSRSSRPGDFRSQPGGFAGQLLRTVSPRRVSARQALARIEEAVEIRRRLAIADPATFDLSLAPSLSNLANRLFEAGHERMHSSRSKRP